MANPPQTPHKQDTVVLEHIETPMTPKNKGALSSIIQDIARAVQGADGIEQQRAMVKTLDDFNAKLMGKLGIIRDDEGSEPSTSDDEVSDSDGDSDLEDLGKTNKQTKNGGMGAEEEQSTVIKVIHIGMTSAVGVVAVRARQSEFFDSLQNLAVRIEHRKTIRPLQKFNHSSVVDITNFFFSDLIGNPALARIGSIIRAYQGQGEGLPAQVHAAEIASRLANDDSITYTPIRNFYHAFAQSELNRSNTQSAIGQLRININGVELMSAMEAIRAAANRKDRSLQDFLAVQGYKCGRGQRIINRALTYCADKLKIERPRLVSTCQQSVGLYNLVQCFGWAILLLVPTGTGNKLNKWGNQMMERVYPLFHTHAAPLQPVLDDLLSWVFDPIRTGLKVEMAIPKSVSEDPFETRIHAARQEWLDQGGHEAEQVINHGSDHDHDDEASFGDEDMIEVISESGMDVESN